jgi:hypothetical protein
MDNVPKLNHGINTPTSPTFRFYRNIINIIIQISGSVPIKGYVTYTGTFLKLLTRSRLPASRRLVCFQPLDACEFCRRLSMLDGRYLLRKMNENNKPVHDFCAAGSCYRCHELFLPSKHLVSSVLRHSSIYFRATRISV